MNMSSRRPFYSARQTGAYDGESHPKSGRSRIYQENQSSAGDIEFEKARIIVTTKDGSKLTENVTKVKGDPKDNPMSHDEIIAKFWVNVDFTQRISQKKAIELLDKLLNLEKVNSVRKLIPLLVA